MFHRPTHALISCVLVAALLGTTSSCGNAWVTSSEREQTLAALMSKGEYAYDKSRFDEAATHFGNALAKDPSNTDARIKLAYSLNGKAGLNILDFVAKFLVTDENKGTTEEGSTTSSSAKPLEILTTTVGLTEAERNEIQSKSITTMAELRAASPKFATLTQSWNTICPLIPKEIFDSVFTSEGNSLKVPFGYENCNEGLAEGQSPKSAALFAAALQFMAQVAGLFQTTLDKNGDNEIDLVVTGVNAVAEIEKLQKESQALTDGATASPEAYASNLKKINEQLEVIRGIRNTINSELVSYTFGSFAFVTQLLAKIANLPKDITKKIEDASAKITEGRTKLASYSTFDSSSTNADQGKKVKDAATKAAQTIDELYTKANAITDPAAREARIKALDENKEKVCQNFEATKTEFNLPADVKAPSSCASVTLLTTPMTVTNENSKSHDLLSSETAGNMVSRSEDVAHDSQISAETRLKASNVGDRTAFVEFGMFGEELLR